MWIKSNSCQCLPGVVGSRVVGTVWVVSLCKDDPAYDCVCGKSWESRESQGNSTLFFLSFFTSRGYYGSLKTHILVTHLPSCAHGKHYGFCQAQMNLTAPIHICDGPWHEGWIPSVCSATTNSFSPTVQKAQTLLVRLILLKETRVKECVSALKHFAALDCC